MEHYIFICHDLDERIIAHNETGSFNCDLEAVKHAFRLSSDYFDIEIYRRIDIDHNIKVATIY